MLGDSMLQADGTPWMADLAHEAPKINWDDMTQIPALPLGSWLKIDPWDDHVHMLNAKRYAPMLPHDKMPLEVTPIYFRLQRYEQANATAAAGARRGATRCRPPGRHHDAAEPATTAGGAAAYRCGARSAVTRRTLPRPGSLSSIVSRPSFLLWIVIPRSRPQELHPENRDTQNS